MYLSLLPEKCSTDFYDLLARDLSCMLITVNGGAVAEESVLLLPCPCSLQGKVAGSGEMLSVSSAAPKPSSRQLLYLEMGWGHRWHTERNRSVIFPFHARSPTWADQLLVLHVLAELGCLRELPYMLPLTTSLPRCPDDKTLFLLGGICQKFSTFPLLMAFSHHGKLEDKFCGFMLVWNAFDFSE